MPPKPRPKVSNGSTQRSQKTVAKRDTDNNGRRKPVWEGPYSHGITFSLLSKFLVCRERFRLKVVEGLREAHAFNHTLEYGSMWHAAEEALAGGHDWVKSVRTYSSQLVEQYPTESREVGKWRDICLLVFPLYIQYWKKHAVTVGRKKVLEEVGFRVPYRLPSGRTILLRGKYDAIFRIGSDLYIQENKSKGKIDEEGIQATVAQNLQSMFYQIALRSSLIQTPGLRQIGAVQYLDTTEELRRRPWGGPSDNRGIIKFPTISKALSYRVAGVLYNVVRRPLADRYSIKQRIGRGKSREGAETDQQFYRRVADTVKQDLPYHFFRWQVLLSEKDISTFRQRVFDPIMEQLCDWWDSIQNNPFDPWTNYSMSPGCHGTPPIPVRLATPNRLHWQAPFGVYNGMYDGYRGDYFELLAKGRKHNLETVTELFPELQ